ncbi:iron-sulfur cluster repair di-iron protein [Ulvibacter litoralis]|uniref:Regulator of cell morphogenesis and NO signaling n=1 Tax=Ulvibacter litoralis TaxID=227084 RepID=A0A1G7CFD9_9FLAO|nr:iron-sulfur cluster repair di-iron protein [Ulvibacter litoralis]GHC47576.1 iron-sulfur cluster repair di-iron protein [Ulvibacter litoralis]SDE38047.1 regulator of cell morphogenesis and NO signaling [Ulvibacter litoralis]
MMEIKEQEVGQFVAQDFRTAAVFSEYGIDFCCKGNRPLTAVCEKNGIAIDEILEKLSGVLGSENNAAIDYKSWPLDLLAVYIEKIHHTYVQTKIPVIHKFLDKLCKVHGANHPELFEINREFLKVSEELLQHMQKEEQVLFPEIKRMVKSHEDNIPMQRAHFGTVKNPITMMEHEHDDAGEIFRTIARLTNNYMPPSDACNTYKVTFSMLDAFEKDLHLHIHLENNILFPGALKLEKQLF